MPRGGSSFTVCFSLSFLSINDITGILKQKFLVRVRSPFFGRHGHSFLPIWLKFDKNVTVATPKNLIFQNPSNYKPPTTSWNKRLIPEKVAKSCACICSGQPFLSENSVFWWFRVEILEKKFTTLFFIHLAIQKILWGNRISFIH